MVEKIIRDEIGSEFWDIPTTENAQISFPNNTMWFISGTSALQFIIQDVMKHRNIRSVAVPSWCCSCMIEPFIKQKIDVWFYSVYIDAQGILTKDYTTAPKCDMTMSISYFGYLRQNTIGSPSGVVISDLTHSLFCERPTDATYFYGSLRKWAGFWTGGYAWKNGEWGYSEKLKEADEQYINLRKAGMERKLQYLQGARDDKSYLNMFEQAEDYLDNCEIICGSDHDVFSAWHFDVDAVKTKRRENAQYLISELGEHTLFKELSENDCPLFVPLILEEDIRNELRQYLIDRQIYCPVHWGITNLHRLTDKQMYIYDHELSIVCDQRYGQKDMERVSGYIKDYLKRHH